MIWQRSVSTMSETSPSWKPRWSQPKKKHKNSSLRVIKARLMIETGRRRRRRRSTSIRLKSKHSNSRWASLRMLRKSLRTCWLIRRTNMSRRWLRSRGYSMLRGRSSRNFKSHRCSFRRIMRSYRKTFTSRSKKRIRSWVSCLQPLRIWNLNSTLKSPITKPWQI